MLDLPALLKDEYVRLLQQQRIPSHNHNFYLKWLRFYFDFCKKYQHAPALRNSLPLFIKKLQGKKQSLALQKQAAHAVTLYYALQGKGLAAEKTGETKASPKGAAQMVSFDAATRPPASPWGNVYATLDAAIKIRHYSPNTYKTYASWIRKLQYFTRGKAPGSLSTEDVKAFLTHLAVQRKVAASTQNQAFNALLFLFRHILKKDFEVEGVVRAKRKKSIPVVLSREEIDRILEHLWP